MSISKFNCICACLVLLAAPVQSGQWEDYSGISVNRLGDHVRIGGPAKDGIPALTRPEFVAPEEMDFFGDDAPVMGVYMHGIARAYPEALGWWHEIINDEIGGQGIAVTLCPLTGTAMNFNTTDAAGDRFELGVSGLLINSNLVMYDRRDDQTLYPQMIYTGFNSELAGVELELLPIVATTWGMWKQMYPDTQIAVPTTGMGFYSADKQQTYSNIENYNRYPYGSYRTDSRLNRPPTTASPDLVNFHPKEIVLGLCRNGVAKSYHFEIMPDGAVINDEIGDEQVVIVFDRNSGTAIPYFSNVDGQELTFFAVEASSDLPIEFEDVETRTRWNMLGHAISGELEGHKLEQVPAYNSMWFAWDTYWQGAPIWDGEGIIDAPAITAVEEEDGGQLPSAYALGQNYPNPFNPSTHFQVSLPRPSPVSLRVYDTVGQLVRILMEGEQDAGFYLFSWDGTNEAGADVASGTYLYRLEAPEAGLRQTRRMTLLR